MPLFVKGSLADKLATVDAAGHPTPMHGGPFGFDFFFRFSCGLLRALKYLHRHHHHLDPVVHGDIKPANILMSSKDEPALTDFGQTKRGTPYYMSPEQANTDEDSLDVTPATDIFSAALVMYEILCAPRKLRNSNETVQGKVPPLDDVPKEVAALLQRAWSIHPLDRPTASELLRSMRAIGHW